jgi:ABC-2 type transport system ATP-binding protein
MTESELCVRCVGLIKRYQDVTAVDGVDLAIRRGECFGLLGPNGAGKTTTIEILEGLTQPDAGLVEVLGMRWGKDAQRIRQHIGVQLQESQLGDKLTVHEVLVLFRSLYAQGREPEELMHLFELESKRDAMYQKLSGGQKQRLTLACALVSEPKLLFLDEPTTGLDPQARLKVWEVVRSYLAGGGSVLITTHYMEEAARLCDRLAIMDHGKVIALGTPAELIGALNTKQIVEFEAREAFDHEALGQRLSPATVTRRGNRHVVHTDDMQRTLPQLFAELERLAGGVTSLRTHEPTLDDVFLSLTGKALRDE